MGNSERESVSEFNRRLAIVESSARAGIKSNNAILEVVSDLKAEEPSFIGRFFRRLKPKSMEVDKPVPIAVMDEAESNLPEDIYGEPMGRIATTVPATVVEPAKEESEPRYAALRKYSSTELEDTPVLGFNTHPKVRAHYQPERVEALRNRTLKTKLNRRPTAYRKFNQLCDFIGQYAPGVTMEELVEPMGISTSTLRRLRGLAFSKHMIQPATVAKSAKPTVAKSAKPTVKTKKRVTDTPVGTIQVQPAYGGELSPVPQVTPETPDTLAKTYHPEKLNVFREKALKSGDADQIARYEELAKFAREYLTGELYIDNAMKMFGLDKDWKFYTRFRNVMWDTHTWGREKQSELSNKGHKKGAKAKANKGGKSKATTGTIKGTGSVAPKSSFSVVSPIKNANDALARAQSAKDSRVEIVDVPSNRSIDPRSPHSVSTERIAASAQAGIRPPSDFVGPDTENVNMTPMWTRYGMFVAGNCPAGDSKQRYAEDCAAIMMHMSGVDAKTINKSLGRDLTGLLAEVFSR